MKPSAETTIIKTYETQSCLVVPIQEELTSDAAKGIQRGILEQIHARSIKGVIIDLSGVNIIDRILWEIFSKTAQMIQMLGFSCVITGLNPGVVASIIDLNLDIDDITTAMDLESALQILIQAEGTNLNSNEDLESDDDMVNEEKEPADNDDAYGQFESRNKNF